MGTWDAWMILGVVLGLLLIFWFFVFFRIHINETKGKKKTGNVVRKKAQFPEKCPSCNRAGVIVSHEPFAQVAHCRNNECGHAWLYAGSVTEKVSCNCPSCAIPEPPLAA
ncbi:MAG: hypothetical protein AAB710_00965 [Patescibacteria group bacterium]